MTELLVSAYHNGPLYNDVLDPNHNPPGGMDPLQFESVRIGTMWFSSFVSVQFNHPRGMDPVELRLVRGISVRFGSTHPRASTQFSSVWLDTVA